MAGKHAGTAQAVIGADGMLEQSHPDCLGDQGRGHPLSIAVTEHCEKPAWGEGLLWHMVSAHQFDPDVSGSWRKNILVWTVRWSRTINLLTAARKEGRGQ